MCKYTSIPFIYSFHILRQKCLLYIVVWDGYFIFLDFLRCICTKLSFTFLYSPEKYFFNRLFRVVLTFTNLFTSVLLAYAISSFVIHTYLSPYSLCIAANMLPSPLLFFVLPFCGASLLLYCSYAVFFLFAVPIFYFFGEPGYFVLAR